jgi:WD40 repeat protein
MKRLFLSALSATTLILLALPSGAQILTYGKNKVQYTSFEWQVLEGEGVDLYYYSEEIELASIALETAEEWIPYMEQVFGHRLSRRVPFIVFSSHHHFQQTNVSPYFLPEGVAGMTEHMKGRVVVPFNGSLVDFRRTIRHEFVHVFQLSILEEVYRRHPMTELPYLPLWFTEGLADYLPERWDTDGDMVMRDLVTSNLLPPLRDLDRLGFGYVTYKAGQSAVGHLIENYGLDKIALIYGDLWKGRNFTEILQRSCYISIDKMGEDWAYGLKLKYFPEFREYGGFLPQSTVASPDFYCFKPRLVKGIGGDSSSVVYLGLDSGYTTIRRATMNGGEAEAETILQGQRQAQYESLHPFQSRMDVTDGGLLAFVSKHGETDALVIHDLNRGEEIDSEKFYGLVSISSPSWSPDGSAMVFSAMSTDGRADLYVYDRVEETLDRLTNDWYNDVEPAWSPDGRWIAFVSDRTHHGWDGSQNLFLFDLQNREMLYLTNGPWKDAGPAWSEDGEKLLFTSDREGIRNVYSTDLSGKGRRESSFVGAALDPQWGPGEDEFTFAGYNQGTFRLYTAKFPPDTTPPFELDEPLAAVPWDPEGGSASMEYSSSEYSPQYGLDFAQGGVLVDPTLGAGQGLQFVMSDMMGDRVLVWQVSNTAQTTDELLSHINLAVVHFNLGNRVNYGYGAYHLVGDFYDESGLPFFERRIGGEFIARYPFSRYARTEASAALYHSTKEELLRDRKGVVLQNHLSLIRDTSLWLMTGPIDGERYRLSFGISTDLSSGTAENVAGIADLRKYFRIGPRSAYAVRFLGEVSYGSDPYRFSLGGPFSLRGYPRFSLTGTRALLLSQEVRFPMVRRFVLSTPLGGLEFPSLQGVVFFDAATAWVSGDPTLEPLGSFGLGLRLGLGPFAAMKIDIAKLTDFETVMKGTEVDFSLGWNY